MFRAPHSVCLQWSLTRLFFQVKLACLKCPTEFSFSSECKHARNSFSKKYWPAWTKKKAVLWPCKHKRPKKKLVSLLIYLVLRWCPKKEHAVDSPDEITGSSAEEKQLVSSSPLFFLFSGYWKIFSFFFLVTQTSPAAVCSGTRLESPEERIFCERLMIGVTIAHFYATLAP